MALAEEDELGWSDVVGAANESCRLGKAWIKVAYVITRTAQQIDEVRPVVRPPRRVDPAGHPFVFDSRGQVERSLPQTSGQLHDVAVVGELEDRVIRNCGSCSSRLRGTEFSSDGSEARWRGLPLPA
jgi:hypothetical protein